jgi:uncharacterized membrane protein required for colicin V production
MNVLIADMSFFSLNNFDILMFGIVGFSVIFGLVRGFIKSFISLAGWIIAMTIGMKFYFLLEPVVSKYITLSVVAAVIAGITLFLISAIIIAIINNVFYIAFEALCGGLLDRSLGLLFGFIRGCLLVSFIFYILLMIMPQLNVKDKKDGESIYSSTKIPSWAKSSETILLLNKGAVFINEIMPIDFKRKLKQILSPESHMEEQKEGLVAVESSKPSTSVADVNEDSVHIILNLLPKEVIDTISQEDLILLQDGLTPLKEKARILEEISKKYQEYINNEETSEEDLSKDEIDMKNLKYYKLMGMIENQIIEYNNE